MAEPDAVDVMRMARAVLLLNREGRRADALKQAQALALDHAGSAVAHRLLGDLHFAAAIDARGAAVFSLEEEEEVAAEAAIHLSSACDELSRAKLLVPGCVDTATALADAFAESSMDKEAETEYLRALDIPIPVDRAGP